MAFGYASCADAWGVTEVVPRRFARAPTRSAPSEASPVERLQTLSSRHDTRMPREGLLLTTAIR